MKMKIEIDVHIPEDEVARSTEFIEQVVELFRSMYGFEKDYKSDGTPQVTVSYWNEDGAPRKI